MPIDTLVCHSSAAMHALKLQFDFQMSALCHLFNIPTHTCLSWSLLWRWRCVTEVKVGFYSNCAYLCPPDPPDQHASVLCRLVLRILKLAAFCKILSFIILFLKNIYLFAFQTITCLPFSFLFWSKRKIRQQLFTEWWTIAAFIALHIYEVWFPSLSLQQLMKRIYFV